MCAIVSGCPIHYVGEGDEFFYAEGVVIVLEVTSIIVCPYVVRDRSSWEEKTFSHSKYKEHS